MIIVSKSTTSSSSVNVCVKMGKEELRLYKNCMYRFIELHPGGARFLTMKYSDEMIYQIPATSLKLQIIQSTATSIVTSTSDLCADPAIYFSHGWGLGSGRPNS